MKLDFSEETMHLAFEEDGAWVQNVCDKLATAGCREIVVKEYISNDLESQVGGWLITDTGKLPILDRVWFHAKFNERLTGTVGCCDIKDFLDGRNVKHEFDAYVYV
jgi:hypothetical protein